MKNKSVLYLFFAALLPFYAVTQENTFSPYSRYALGERFPATFSHNQGMGGAFIALKPDSTMPVFINAGNPAAYPLVRVTTLEVGGRFKFSDFSNGQSSVQKWTTNFSYGALAFPMGRRGGGAFGIMPYSTTGYDTRSEQNLPAGNISYLYGGSGGANKAFLGYGINPFQLRLAKFRYRHMSAADTLNPLSPAAFKTGHFLSKMLSDLSLGANANYIFGNVSHTSRIVYPSGILYNNTYAERSYVLSGFSGNLGIQTAVTVDSAGAVKTKRALKEKVKFTFGYYMSLGNNIRASRNLVSYNYVYNSSGQEIVSDTVYYAVEQPATVVLPLEQGFGIGFKKGERLNIVADLAFTFWEGYSGPHNPGALQNSFRTAIGANIVPEKYAAGRGAFWRKANYRFGGGYESGYINISNTSVSTWFVSAGFGMPVGIGRLSSMVNISAQAGQTGSTANGLLRENFFRVHFGFTFCDKWFQKYRYD